MKRSTENRDRVKLKNRTRVSESFRSYQERLRLRWLITPRGQTARPALNVQFFQNKSEQAKKAKKNPRCAWMHELVSYTFKNPLDRRPLLERNKTRYLSKPHTKPRSCRLFVTPFERRCRMLMGCCMYKDFFLSRAYVSWPPLHSFRTCGFFTPRCHRI